jgi:hypothetical protein
MDKTFVILPATAAAKRLGYSTRNIYRMARLRRVVGKKIRGRWWIWVEV